MRKYLYIAATIALLSVGTGALAAGFNFSSSSKINLSSGSQITQSAPSGTITGFSTHPSGTCGANSAMHAQILGAGANYQRTDILWKTVQSTSSASYVWGGYDCMVDEAAAKGISTLFIIHDAPQWAAYANCTVASDLHCAPASSAAFGTFAGAVAAHFKGRISALEIWNEPNISFWKPSPTTTDYVLSLNAAYTAIKAVDPTIQVVSAGLAPTTDSATTIAITTFTTGMYSAGATFDKMGAHPYSYPWGLTKGDSTSNGWQALLAVRNTMVANGDSAKKIWITEVGMPTCGPGSALDIDANGGATDYGTFDAQKELFRQITATSSGSSYIEKIFAYTLRDQDSTDSSSRENCFGLYFTNGKLKPAYQIIRGN